MRNEDTMERDIPRDIEKEELGGEISDLMGKIALEEVTQSNKSILDLPQLAWGNITTHFEGREYFILNACLSSPCLEQLITNGSPTNKLRLLGEKVFSLSITRYHVSRRDMQNCLNTTCQDLQYFAGSSWWCFQSSTDTNSVIGKRINLENRDQIRKFSQTVTEVANKWDFFKGRDVSFCYDTKSDYDQFHEAAILLMKAFGKYMMYVEWWYQYPIPISREFCPNLHIIFPRLKRVYLVPKYLTSCPYTKSFRPTDRNYAISSQLSDRTVEPLLTIDFDNFLVLKKISAGTSETNFRGCKISSPNMWYIQHIEKSYNVLAADLLSTVRSLIVDGFTGHFRSIGIVGKFPNVTNVVFSGRVNRYSNRINSTVIPNLVFSRIKELTFGILREYKKPPSLDILRRHFPLLRSLTIRDDDDFSCFNEKLSNWRNFRRVKEGVIDVYRLYSQNRSLNESNIWSEMSHLKTLCMDVPEFLRTSEHLLGEDKYCKLYTRRQDIYRRIETGRIILDITLSS